MGNPVCQVSTASAPWELPGSPMPRITNLDRRLRSRTRPCAASSVAASLGHGSPSDQRSVKEGPVASRHEPIKELMQPRQVNPRALSNTIRVDAHASNQGAQHPQNLELAARVDLHEEVGLLGRGRARLIDDDHGPADPAVGNEPPPRFNRIALPVPGMAHHRVSAPEDDDVRPVLDLAQGGRDPADTLKREKARSGQAAVTGLDDRSNPIRQFQGGRHSLIGGPAQPQNDRRLGLHQHPGCQLDGLVLLRGLVFDEGGGEVRLMRPVPQQPLLSQGRTHSRPR